MTIIKGNSKRKPKPGERIVFNSPTVGGHVKEAIFVRNTPLGMMVVSHDPVIVGTSRWETEVPIQNLRKDKPRGVADRVDPILERRLAQERKLRAQDFLRKKKQELSKGGEK